MSANEFMGYLVSAVVVLLGIIVTINNLWFKPKLEQERERTKNTAETNYELKEMRRDISLVQASDDKQNEILEDLKNITSDHELRLTKVEKVKYIKDYK